MALLISSTVVSDRHTKIAVLGTMGNGVRQNTLLVSADIFSILKFIDSITSSGGVAGGPPTATEPESWLGRGKGLNVPFLATFIVISTNRCSLHFANITNIFGLG